MTFEVKGWCPSTLRPMMSGDGLLVRVTPPLARLSVGQAKGLARAARRFGNGLIDLSARGNIQLRGITDHAALLEDLRALGLIHDGPTCVVSPFWTDEDGTTFLHNLLQVHDLPDKFGFAIDVGVRPVLHGTAADIRIERQEGGYLVRADGATLGACAASPAEAAEIANQMARWFVTQGPAKRMAEIPQANLPPAFATTPMLQQTYHPQPGAHPMGQMVGLAFGQITAEALEKIAEFSLRITPWRMILIEGQVAHPDLITTPDDARLRVTACTGAPGCPQGLQPTRGLAQRLAAAVPAGQHLHVSGCAKGCAHPKAADITLCARASGFGVIRKGRASDPVAEPLTLSTLLFKAL